MITNIDLDHTDVHASLDTLTADFKNFAADAIAAGGWVHLSKECGNDLVAWSSGTEQELWAKISIQPDEHAIYCGTTAFKVGLAGKHNLMNATLVLQLGLKLGIDSAIISQVLQNFSGVNRRMQKLAEFPALNLVVIDDYAHHPHEVASTLAALKPQYERLLVFWEPHRLSRFTHFHSEFETVLRPYAENGMVIALPVYQSGDKPADYPEVNDLYQKFTRSPYRAIAVIEELDFASLNLKTVKTAAVFMGAGRSSEYAKEFVNRVSGGGFPLLRE